MSPFTIRQTLSQLFVAKKLGERRTLFREIDPRSAAPLALPLLQACLFLVLKIKTNKKRYYKDI